jgi:hypothetical protein
MSGPLHGRVLAIEMETIRVSKIERKIGRKSNLRVQ